MNRFSPKRSIAVSGLRSLSLDVPDLVQAPRFFAALGAVTSMEDDRCSVRTMASEPICLRLTAAATRKLRRLGFEAPIADIQAITARAAAAGIQILEASPRRLLLAGPDGIESEIVAESHPHPGTSRDFPPMLPHAPLHGELVMPRPQRLCHAAIFVTELGGGLAFYCDVLGLRLSDRCGDDLAFLHSPHGGDHHILALVRSTGPGLHHYSFEMGTIDAIGLRADHLAEHGFAAGWGLGRHVLGSNFFHYVRDPWGCHAELTTGLDQIPADIEWLAGDHEAEDAFYLWGPPPPADFIENSEAQAAERSLVGA